MAANLSAGAGRFGRCNECVLDALILVTPSATTFETAPFLDPSILRSLEILHLAASQELGDD
ncbi:hypothetical protein [Tessaracoccus caeni]|uniref:hypothetical protein n=1 Tax=Tessaracoccus caeni TaxID=3031239 RepID=UPI0023DC7041|nr:hypothetical protein [Tessaracoccus caeni]MDF1489465.1 hypothetical protein [Tessaracoccus caeni]